MANKIISIDTQTEKKSSEYTYADVSMIAKSTSSPKPKQLAIIIKLLKQEGLDNGIMTEDDINAICIYYDKTNDITAAYNLWLKKAKYKVGKNIDVVAVQNAVHNIFTWIPGERILNPEFGTNLRKMLYEGITDENMEKIASEINRVLTTWEPRVTIQLIVNITSTDDKENNTVVLRIIYTINGLSDEAFTYDYVAASEAY